MSITDEIDFNNICRTCLCTENLEPLYDKCSPEICLSEKLMLCTSMEYYENDGLPMHMCTDCINAVTESYKFALKCRETDAKLRNYQQTIETEEDTQCYDEQTSVVLEDPLEISGLQYGLKTETIQVDDQLIEPIKIVHVCTEQGNDDVMLDVSSEEELDISGMPILKDSKPKGHQCNICLKYFNSYLLLKEHHRTHGDLKISCDEPVRKHLRQHARRNGYLCKECDKIFSRKATLRIHMRLHTGEKPYVCEICSRTFRQPQHLRGHLRTHHRNQCNVLQDYACKVCGDTFRQSHHLFSHMRAHGQKRHECPDCKETFEYKKELKLHAKTHTFPCTMCVRTFRSKLQLENHMKMHSCPVCGFTLKNGRNLRYHMKIHKVDQSFPCTICNETFYTERLLAAHAQVHVGTKPFPCIVCERSFNLLSNLTSHLKTHCY